MIRQGRNPAARVYESIGSECFLALAPGWLNLGLWEGPGTEAEAEAACRRLVQTVASALPAGGVIVDVGNGLGTQDPLIAESFAPRRLVAVNIAEWQLAAGRDRLREAAAAPVAGDAARLPLADAGRRRADQRGGGVPLPLPPRLLRRVLPGAAARRRAEHHRHLDRAMATDSRRAGLRPGPAAGVRAPSRRGDDRRADRRGRPRGRPGGRGGNAVRRPRHRPRAPGHRGPALAVHRPPRSGTTPPPASCCGRWSSCGGTGSSTTCCFAPPGRVSSSQHRSWREARWATRVVMPRSDLRLGPGGHPLLPGRGRSAVPAALARG